MKKLKKWQLTALIAVPLAIVVVVLAMLFLNQKNGNQEALDSKPLVQKAKEGSVASSVLLSGQVSANNEQYIYYDSTKGDLEGVLVNVGDQVTVGQALVQYRNTEAQSNYDSAVRALNKIDRQIYELQNNGTAPTPSPTAEGEESGESTAPAVNTQQSLDSQLKDLQDNRADAADKVNSSKLLLDATTVLSTVEGTVVEVNRDVSKSTIGSNQTLVHIVNNGNLQVKGELSEYNLANLSVGQEVSITSKVYPDKTWTGKISYISNYPKDAQQASSSASAVGGSGGGSGAKYPFTIDFTSEIGDLKQGFSVNIEVKNNSKAILIPVSSVVTDEDGKNYIWKLDDKGIAKKVEVTLGNADAENQEVTSGLSKDDKVIINPTADLKDGQEVKSYEEIN